MEHYSMVAPSTFVLKANISCRGCERDIKKVLQKIPGVWPDSTVIDAEQGRVTVSGLVDPQTVIRKLRKAGKIAELLVKHNAGAPPAANDRNLEIISRSVMDVGNPRGQVVVVDPFHLVAINMAQVLNAIKPLKELEVTPDRIKMSFYDCPSGGNWKYGGTSRGSGGGGTTSISTSMSSRFFEARGGGDTTSIRSGGGGTSIRSGRSGGGGATTSIRSGRSGATTSIRSSGSRRINL